MTYPPWIPEHWTKTAHRQTRADRRLARRIRAHKDARVALERGERVARRGIASVFVLCALLAALAVLSSCTTTPATSDAYVRRDAVFPLISIVADRHDALVDDAAARGAIGLEQAESYKRSTVLLRAALDPSHGPRDVLSLPDPEPPPPPSE